jgi:hypothetical protein
VLTAKRRAFMAIAQRLNLVAMCAAFALVGAVVFGLF